MSSLENLETFRVPRISNCLKATAAVPREGRGAVRTRRGLGPRHAQRGRPRHLGGPRFPRLESQRRGRSSARETGATTDGARESEGCKVASTSGNEVALGPGRAKAARVDASFNPILRGWVNYFAIGHASRCFGYVRDWVEKKIRRHMMRARKLQGFGWTRWSRGWLYDLLGLFGKYRVRQSWSTPKALPTR